MKLYHYIIKGNTPLTEGILSFAKNPKANLRHYFKRSGQTTHEGIVKWFESCFEGRSRGIRGFSEPIKWYEHSKQCLKSFVDRCDCYSIDVDALEKDGLLEAVYVSPSVLEDPDAQELWYDEVLVKLDSYKEISTAPVDWSICNDEKGWRFAFVPYYVIIVKDGLIPPKYIQKEN